MTVKVLQSRNCLILQWRRHTEGDKPGSAVHYLVIVVARTVPICLILVTRRTAAACNSMFPAAIPHSTYLTCTRRARSHSLTAVATQNLLEDIFTGNRGKKLPCLRQFSFHSNRFSDRMSPPSLAEPQRKDPNIIYILEPDSEHLFNCAVLYLQRCHEYR